MSTSLLSTREIQILHAIATGQDPDSVAKTIDRAPRTVKEHLTSAYRALGARDRGHALGEAFRLGYLAVDPISRQIVANPYGRRVRETGEQ